MKFKIIFILLLILLFGHATTHASLASTARSSAKLADANLINNFDDRPLMLQKFLEVYGSPLAPYARTFVKEADKNHLDWKLVVAIAGNESYFGQQIPPNSYNAWGFGVFGTNVRRFSSFDEGISVVSYALRKDYINTWRAKNVYEIGSIYAADPQWANKVVSYMDKLEEFESNTSNLTLSISL